MTASINNINKKRIAKNTLLLYVRMFFMLAVGFFSVRLLLQNLGVTDYGLYNVIFGLVTMFSFFTGAMSSTVQRFLCQELGRSNKENTVRVFSVSVFLFIALAVIVLLLAETVGLWFVCCKMNVPEGRMSVAQIVYQLSIAMVILKMLQIPYMAVITSHENMRTFSQISILEAIFHLIAVWILKFIPESRLIYFVILYTAGNLFILFYYVIYCHCRYDICRIRSCVDREYLRSMLSFFSWSLLGAVANMSKQQGLNVLLNVFCGVVLNATWGIATQVGGAVNQFVTSFQQAFNPQILKSYSTSSREEYLNLLQNCSKYSFMLIWIVALPILLQTEFLLKLWLGKDLPAETVIFTQWMVLYMVIDAVSGPLWMAVQATGNIKRYQFEVSCLICSTFLFSFIVLKCGGAAYWVVIINVIINFACLVYRLFYLNKNIQLAIFRFCQKVCFPIIAIGVISYIAGIMLKPLIGNSIGFILIYLFGILVISFVVCLLIGLSKHEKYLLRNLLISRFK